MSGQVNQVTLRISQDGAEAVKASMAALGKDGEAALARLNFETVTSGSRGFSAVLQEGTGIARGYASELGPLGGVLSTLGGGWLAAGAAAGAFGFLLEEGLGKAEAYDQTIRGLEATLRATGDASGVTAEDVEGMADRIAHSSLQSREAVISAAEELASFGNVAPDAFEKTLNAAADLAASPAFKGDIVAAVKVIGAAMEGNFAQFKRAAPEVNQAQLDIIKHMEDTGDEAGALQVILNDLAGAVGGDASAQAGGLTGKTHNLGLAWDHFAEGLGHAAAKKSDADGLLGSLAAGLDNLDKIGRSEGFLKVFALMGAGMAFSPALVLNPFLNAPQSAGQTTAPKTYADHAVEALNDPLYADQSDLNAALGPLLAAANKLGNQLQGMGDFNAAAHQKADELRQTPLKQSIDKYIGEEAAKAKVSVADFSTKPEYASKYQDSIAAATDLYDAQNAGKWAAQADAAAKHAAELAAAAQRLAQEQAAAYATLQIARDHDLLDFDKYLAGVEADEAKAHSEQIKAQDELTLDLLKGQAGYFAAAHDAQEHESEAALQIIDADTNKQLAGLDERYAQFTSKYGLDATAAAEYAQAKATIMMSWSEKTTAQLAADQQKQLDLTREAEGDLAKWIDMANADATQSLKTLASDGLGTIDNALKAVASGTEKVGDAAKSALLDITGDIFQKGVETQILGPLGKWLNGEIGDGAKADGSEDNPFYVKLAGLGGLGGGGGGLLSDFFDSIGFGSKGVSWDDTPLSTTLNPADLISTLPGFATGGEFDIPSGGGTDSRVVAFRATPGETVSIRTPSQRNYVDPMKGGGSAGPSAAPVVNNTNHFHMSGAVSEQAVKSMIQQGMGQAVQTVKSNLLSWWQDQWARFQN